MWPFLAWSRNGSCSFIHHPSRGAGVTVVGAWAKAEIPPARSQRKPIPVRANRRESLCRVRMVGTC